MLRLFERTVLRHNQTADQPAQQAGFVAIVVVILPRQPYQPVLGIQFPHQRQHGAPIGFHPGAGLLVGGNTGTVLVPAQNPIIAADRNPLHGKQPGSKVLGKADAAIHLLQRIQENSALVHCFNAADAVIVQQHIAADSLVIVVGRIVGGAVKRRLPGQLHQRAVAFLPVIGGLSKGHLRSVPAQHLQHPADGGGIVHIISRRDTGDPLPAGQLHRVEHISDRALVDLVFGQFYVGKAVGR